MSYGIRVLRAGARLTLGWSVYALSFLMPRKHLRWVFIGWQSNAQGEVFADNAKYFFLYAAMHGIEHGIEVIWLAKDAEMERRLNERGYKVARRGTLLGAWYALTAKVTIVDANLKFADWQYVGKSRLIQLWHGITIKKIGAQLNGIYKHPSPFLNPELCRPYDLIVAPSPRTARIMVEALGAKPERVFLSNYPRNDVLTEEVPGADIDAYNIPPALQHARKAILYVPTFRPAGAKEPLSYWDFEALMPVLEKHDAVLCVQYHSKAAGSGNLSSQQKNNRIIFLEGRDIHPLLKEFDVQISDYSSLPFDTLLIDQPVIYYQYDYDLYANGTGLQPDYKEVVIGPQVRTFSELCSVLDATLNGDDKYKQKRAEVKKIMFSYPEHGSERIFRHLINQLHSTLQK